ncbi:MAG: hypothetical protein IPJ47_22845 [Anaerolineales bacterium]|nr:hypothetical protein [Anaerolineales bacterium]
MWKATPPARVVTVTPSKSKLNNAFCHEDAWLFTEDLRTSAWSPLLPTMMGATREENMYYEIEGLQAALLAEIQKYAWKPMALGSKYDAATYPYFMSADGRIASWTPAC